MIPRVRERVKDLKQLRCQFFLKIFREADSQITPFSPKFPFVHYGLYCGKMVLNFFIQLLSLTFFFTIDENDKHNTGVK